MLHLFKIQFNPSSSSYSSSSCFIHLFDIFNFFSWQKLVHRRRCRRCRYCRRRRRQRRRRHCRHRHFKVESDIILVVGKYFVLHRPITANNDSTYKTELNIFTVLPKSHTVPI